MFQLICASAQGASHIKHNLPCEDFGLAATGDECLLFAAADGHGDLNCPRSQLGAKTACQTAVQEMDAFCRAVRENHWEEKLLSGGKESERLARQLIVSIIAKWTKAVNEDYSEHPLTQEEREGCADYIERYDRGERLEHIYGTTLIAGLMTEEYLLLIQQGDGRCVLFYADGSVSQPIPWDDRCFANITTSLCDEDVTDSCRFYIVNLKETPVAACFAGSDGVEDSFFSMEQMHTYYRDLLVYANQNGVKAMEDHLKETLPEFSSAGSRDDVTIAGIIDEEAIGGLLEKFAQDNEVETLRSMIREIEARLDSLNGMGKYDALKEAYLQAEKENKDAQAALAAADEAYNTYTSDRLLLESEGYIQEFHAWERLMKHFVIVTGSYEDLLQKKADVLKKDLREKQARADETADRLARAEEMFRGVDDRKKQLEDKRDAAIRRLEEIYAS